MFCIRNKVVPPFLQKAYAAQEANNSQISDKNLKPREVGDSDEDDDFDLEAATIANSNMSAEELEMFIRKKQHSKQQAKLQKKITREKEEADKARNISLSDVTFKPKFQTKADR